MEDRIKKDYKNLEAKELVEILESKNQYNSDVIEFCEKLLNSKNIEYSTIKDFSKLIIKERFYQYFMSRKHWEDNPVDLNSRFLDPTEVKECINQAKREYESYMDGATSGLPF